MISLLDVAKAFEDGQEQYRQMMETAAAAPFRVEEIYGGAAPVCSEEKNSIAQGDNLAYMLYLIKEKNMAGKCQLIYADPPFYSKGQYQASLRLESEILGSSPLFKAGAYDDRWSKGMAEYLTMLTVRLLAMRQLLADKGCICVHLDWHVVHYVKVIMDQIFGEKNFINEVIWTYKSGGANKRSFAKKHDTLLLYGKSGEHTFNPLKEKSYNRELKPYRFQGVEEFQDETGWYTLVNMKDVWTIDMVGRTSSERTGYATQKPEKLLERIVAACSDEGDLCADFFAGSGTLGAVCQQMGRRWIMCDEGALSAAEQISRMGALAGAFQVERAADGKTAAGSDSEPSVRFRLHADRIELLDYRMDIPQELKRYEEALARYRSKDSLSMIKSWSADMDWDGGVHRGMELITDGRREWRIQRNGLDGSLRGEGSAGAVHITGYDVFGNRFFGDYEG